MTTSRELKNEEDLETFRGVPSGANLHQEETAKLRGVTAIVGEWVESCITWFTFEPFSPHFVSGNIIARFSSLLNLRVYKCIGKW